jgi:hypothetical protein
VDGVGGVGGVDGVDRLVKGVYSASFVSPRLQKC